MIGAKAWVTPRFQRISKAADIAAYKNIRHALFSISKGAKQSIEPSARPSRPGTPPHTRNRRGRNLKTAIFVDADKDSGIAGPRFSRAGDAGELHELGENRFGDKSVERPFMGPQLDAKRDRFASDWAGTIGE